MAEIKYHMGTPTTCESYNKFCYFYDTVDVFFLMYNKKNYFEGTLFQIT